MLIVHSPKLSLNAVHLQQDEKETERNEEKRKVVEVKVKVSMTEVNGIHREKEIFLVTRILR